MQKTGRIASSPFAADASERTNAEQAHSWHAEENAEEATSTLCLFHPHWAFACSVSGLGQGSLPTWKAAMEIIPQTKL